MPLKPRDQRGRPHAEVQEDEAMISPADCSDGEKLYQILFEQSAAALYLHNLDGNILNVNVAACEQTGYTRDELLTMKVFDLYPEGAADEEQIVRAWKSWSAGERINLGVEHRKKDGSIYPVELSISVVCYAEQICILVTAFDLSYWKSGEQSLRESEAQYRALFEKAPMGYQSLDEQGKIIKVNQAWLDLLGYPRDEVIGRSFGDFLPVEWQNHFKENFPRFKAVGEILGVEFEIIKKDGSTALVSFSGKISRDSDGRFQRSHCVLENISERKLLEEKLQKAQKLESIGNLAGGIAHEFNNILSIIMGNNELVMDELPEWSFARESSEEIRNASLRARDVVKQLLTFSRQDRVKKRILDVREVVGESLKLLRTTLPKNIAIESDLAETVHPIYGSATQLSQILLNLGKNSADAIVTGIGTISISLHNCDVEHENGSRCQVCLKISDTGIGMSKELCKRIFDPYFTTKEVGKGTGIGLSVVYGIVESHGGEIEVDSRPQQGTTFTILLPAAEKTLAENSSPPSPVDKGKEHLLLIDDEESICRMSERMLQSLGYEITACNDPIVALDLFRKNPDTFDCVISDMSMPGMTGEKLLREVLRIRKGIPTILCTGYSETFSARHALQLGIREYLLKPVEREKMAAAVRRVLDNFSTT